MFAFSFEDSFLRKTPAIILITGIFLGCYLTFLLYINFKNREELNNSLLERVQLNFDNQVGSIEYFFSERKHDLLFIANSKELTAYFTNKSLGMSEAYGLKLSVYLVEKMLRKNLSGKTIKGMQIYEGFVLYDRNGQVLIDTDKANNTSLAGLAQLSSFPEQIDDVVTEPIKENGNYHIVLRVPCMSKGKRAGEVVAFLNIDTFTVYFLDSLKGIENSAHAITHKSVNDKTLILQSDNLAFYIGSEKYSELTTAEKLAEITQRNNPHGASRFIAFQKKISETPFDLISLFDKKQLFRHTMFWQIFAGMVGLIIVLLSALFILAQFRVKNKILQVNLLKIVKQQADLAEKNIQLKNEMEERKKAERQKRKIEDRLQQAKKMEGVGQLAAGIAHDLNNILSGIVSLPQLLLLKMPEDSPLRPSLLIIEQSGNKAAQIVQDLLTLSKGGHMAEEIVSLGDIIMEYMQSPERKKLNDTHPGVTLKTNIEGSIYKIKGEKVHLFKLLMNLIRNAADAIEERGEIEIILKNRHIDHEEKLFKDMRPGDYVYLTICDTGSGISEENLKRVFEPFYTRKLCGRKGSGLGMLIAWNTVNEHQGSIVLESEIGKGTLAHICFPKTEESIDTEVAVSEPFSVQGHRERILVVDDTQIQLDIASSILESLNYEVTTVNNGVEAVARYSERPFDMVLLDMIMEPGISGLETTKRIITEFPDAKIVIASGYSESEMIKETLELGALRFVQKPYSVDSISSVIQEVLNPKVQS